MSSVALNDESHFQLIGGVWKGDRAPLKPAQVLRATNFGGDGLIDFEGVVQLDVEERHFSTRKLEQGDIIVERSGGGPKQPVGRVALFIPPDDKPYFSSNFTTVLRICDHKVFNPTYVSLYLHALYLSGATETLQRATTGIRNLDWSEYLRFEIPVIPLSEQKELAHLIGEVRRGYRIERDLVDALSKLKQATMQELFTRGLRGEVQKETGIGLVPESWDVVSFSEAREWLQYGTSIHCTPQKQRYPVLRIPNVEPGRVNPADLKYCNLSDDNAAKYVLQDGDLLFIRTNGVLERLGSCAVYHGEPEKALFASYLIRARLKQTVDPLFVAYFYASSLGTSLVAGRATPAADGKYNLNTGTIDSLPLPVPQTLKEQTQIVSILDDIDRKITLHKQKRAVLEELFKSLLHKLMTGEICVSELNLAAHWSNEATV